MPTIEVKWNILSNHEWCPLCDRNVNVDCGPWPFLAGTVRPVCSDCAAERGIREPYVDHLSNDDKARLAASKVIVLVFENHQAQIGAESVEIHLSLDEARKYRSNLDQAIASEEADVERRRGSRVQ